MILEKSSAMQSTRTAITDLLAKLPNPNNVTQNLKTGHLIRVAFVLKEQIDLTFDGLAIWLSKSVYGESLV